jgi:hypothetical protein
MEVLAMMKTPDELDAEMAARTEEREMDLDAAEADHAAEVEAAKHPHHEGFLHNLKEALDRSPETELPSDAER